ncbi:hypothetical protein PCASD_10414 [Puccinia coronata f. sp. avenae]|uniref:Uncharacterized protein n=1 Tax=Puccinia coronata f. sp. avenae TaxID=200324 RepID=A0A2N5URZ0_9BASI|nr:hypothetical protein PCASD_10414 [Puccinia coronata f. sp. avenae]
MELAGDRSRPMRFRLLRRFPQFCGAAKNLAPRTLQPPAALQQLNMIGQTRLNGQHALWLDELLAGCWSDMVCNNAKGAV